MALALLSELSNVPVSPAIVASGTMGVKLDVGPVGGLGGYGAQTGKIVGVLMSQKVRVTDFVLPAANFDVAEDEMRILREEGVRVHPVRDVGQCLRAVFGLGEKELVGRVKEKVGAGAG